MRQTLDVKDYWTQESLAEQIANDWQRMKSARQTWEAEKRELRNFVFAIDTSTTSVGHSTPWKNSTTIPKICQIRDNLHANYMAALFPNDDWFDWEANDRDSAKKEKKKAILAYMRNKLLQSNFITEVSKLVYDYIDYGNAITEVIYINETHDPEDGLAVSVYNGPKLRRISPLDVVFRVDADSFEDTPKIRRSLVSIGQLEKMVTMEGETGWIPDLIEKLKQRREAFMSLGFEDVSKLDGIKIDGFGSLLQYVTSGLVELLEFEGDLYDITSNMLLSNRKIIIADRAFVAYNEPFQSWLGRSNKFHVGWRLRPDNLMAMGPLDNLIGMQYRLDHLENLKADVFDQIAHPVVYQRGYVETWRWGPGERIIGDTESEVTILAPDTTALNADFQMDRLKQDMEEMAGAPKEAMGIRTPGEKTAFEVQSLETAAGRIFQNKITHFEKVLIEPALNLMLEVARRNIENPTLVAVTDSDIGVQEFLNIAPEDIKAKGTLRPIGARHFARKAQLVQNLNNFGNSTLYSDPAVNAHISGLELARLMVTELLGLPDNLIRENVRVAEVAGTQRLANTAEDQVLQESVVDTQGPIEDEEIVG